MKPKFLQTSQFAPKTGDQNNIQWLTHRVYSVVYELKKLSMQAAVEAERVYWREQSANRRLESVHTLLEHWIAGFHPGDQENVVYPKEHEEVLAQCAQELATVLGREQIESCDRALALSKIATAKENDEALS